MHMSRFRRSAAVVALATVVTGLTVGVGVASAAPSDAAAASGARHGQALPALDRRQRINTGLTISAPDLADTEGKAVVRGRLTARGVPVDHRKVRLLVKRAGATRWALGRIDTTDRRGRVSFRTVPPVETSYQLVFFGTGNLQPSRSAAVTVAARDTKVSIAVTPGVVDLGASVVVSGVVTDQDVATAGVPVELRARKAGTTRAFEPIAAGTTAADGSVSFTTTPSRSTAYVLVARKTGTTQLARSVVATVAVTAPTRIAVRARTIGQTYSVVGVLSSRGDGLTQRKVTLESQAAGSTAWSIVKTKRTARDGYVDFRRTLVEGTSYRLVYAGTTRLQSSTSRTVVA